MLKENFNNIPIKIIDNELLQQSFVLLVHAFIIGCILVVFSIVANMMIEKYSVHSEKESQVKIQDLLLESSNMLMLCVSMATLMIIVDNNLARAFAIGAAVALIRFKGKLTGKAGDTSLLFAVLSGMSIGIGQIKFAYLVSGMYLLIKCILIFAVYLTRIHKK